ncbi:MAG: hypothetical protein ACRC5C_14370 [Bacilli bacterium]
MKSLWPKRDFDTARNENSEEFMKKLVCIQRDMAELREEIREMQGRLDELSQSFQQFITLMHQVQQKEIVYKK